MKAAGERTRSGIMQKIWEIVSIVFAQREIEVRVRFRFWIGWNAVLVQQPPFWHAFSKEKNQSNFHVELKPFLRKSQEISGFA